MLNYLLKNIDMTNLAKKACEVMFNDNEVIAEYIHNMNSRFGIFERIRRNPQIELKQPFYSMSSIIYK